ncbi:hypothetical protein [Proteus mirabilis]|uniref:hypothetical protein n=1 Tax=Proteus mirabilis TaxID=584 RepID=UPI0034D6E850
MKNTLVIAAFPGCGKSTFFREKKNFVVSDSDSSTFDKSQFPTNYIHHIKRLIGEGNHDYIMVSSHDVVREALERHNIKYTLVYPNEECKQEYIERYQQRGNTEGFVKLLQGNFENWVQSCREEQFPTKIELHPGQFLADVL